MITREQLPEGNIRLTFSLPSQEPPGDVSVVGSFNDWCPGTHPLLGAQDGEEDGSDGTRTASIVVEPGTYHFRYLATGGVWFDDEHADTIGEYGGVLHCHRTDAPIGDADPMDTSRLDEELEAVLDSAAPDVESPVVESPAVESEGEPEAGPDFEPAIEPAVEPAAGPDKAPPQAATKGRRPKAGAR